ncbi:hypothetical protein AAFF_G00202330 [Aldrovandia affinis]|uniref:Uncharacterized protein n=1 Tax=Aldrovandia affinis TaxID=143900 RepID=A0AAD7SWU1_9TELE|nr:hypothetical protein AAFF_G00202330 [Aldrovandia affinis]
MWKLHWNHEEVKSVKMERPCDSPLFGRPVLLGFHTGFSVRCPLRVCSGGSGLQRHVGANRGQWLHSQSTFPSHTRPRKQSYFGMPEPVLSRVKEVGKTGGGHASVQHMAQEQGSGTLAEQQAYEEALREG